MKHRAARFVRATSSRAGGRDCMLAPVDGRPIRVAVSGEGHAHVSGDKRCASVWSCPTCAPKIRQRRAEELTQLVEAVQASGGSAVLVTATMPHTRADDLRGLLDDLGAAWRAVWSGRWANELRERFGIVGQVRTVELTYGERSGWHPHVHAVLIFEQALSGAELVELWAPLIVKWQDVAQRVTGRRPDSLGCLDVRPVVDARAISEYVTDTGGWSIGAELAAGPVKIGRSRGRWSPFALLAAAACWGDAEAAELWWCYERATAGRRAIVASRGLLDRYGIGQVAEEDAAGGPEAEDVLGAVELDAMQWAALHAVDAVSVFLGAVEAWAVAGATGPPPDPVEHVRAAVVLRRGVISRATIRGAPGGLRRPRW